MSSFPISISWQVQTPPTASFEQLAKSAQSLDQAMAASAGNFDKFGQTVSQLESPLSGVSGSMGQLEGSMSGLEGSLGSAAGSMGEFAGSTQELNGSISETGGFVTDAASGMGELANGASESGSSMTELGGATGEFNGVISETGGFVQETGTAMGELNTSTGETGTAMGELNTTTGETNTAFGELSPLVTETNTGFAELSPVVTETGTGMTELTTATDDTNTALETSVDALGNVVPGLQDTATGAADSAQGFTDLAPPIEDTNTALDSSTGLLEGVSPLLADTGTNAGTAAGTTEEFSGALGGLNGELGPVNGGLTTENTLLGDVGGTAKTTSGETAGLTGSMSQLGFGIAGVVGSAFSVVGAFQNLRNSQFRVDAANRIVELSAGKLDKALFAMNKTINKLAQDSEGPVTGLNRLVAAQRALNALVDSGVKSGPQFTAALNELKAAHDALGTSTSKDAEAAAKLAFQITGVSTASQKLSIDNNKLTKTLEAQAAAFGDLIAPAVGLTGIAGSLVQSVTGAKAAFTVLKGAMTTLPALFASIGGAISSAVVPAMAALAVPAAKAVAVLAAFTAAVIAIRMNLKVFDDLGTKIGQVFPQLEDSLNSARQTFINLSDGINSAISFILGGIDSFAGGTTNMKAQWEGFTGTLPQGTGEMGIAGQAVSGLGVAFVDAANKVKIGNGAWKDMGGTLVAFSGNVTVAEGSWRKLDDQTVEYVKTANQGKAGFEALTGAVTENATAVETAGAAVKTHLTRYSEMTTAQKLNAISLNEVIQSLSDEKLERFNAIKAAENYLIAHGTTAEAVGLSGDVLIGYVAALQTEAPAYSKSVQEASQYLATKHKEIDLRGKSEDWIIKTAAALQEEDKALAKVTDTTAKHVQELQKLQTTLQENAAELVFYADASNLAGRMQLEFSLGVQEAGLKLIEQQAALARNAGELQGNLVLLEQGKLQEVAYGEGVIEAANAIVTKTQALSKALASYQTTNDLMDEGTILVLAMAKGWLDAQTAIQKNTEALNEQIGALASWTDEATRVQTQQNAALKGWLDQKAAVQEAELAYFGAAGKLRALEEGFGNAYQAMLRLNTGVLTGAANAIEWYQEIETARGEAGGFKSVLVGLADQLGTIPDGFSQSTEQLQRFVGVMRGAPDAIQEVVDGVGELAQTIIDRLSEAGEEGADAFMENLEELENELRTQFSEPVVRAIELAVNMDGAKKQAETALGTMATIIEGAMIPGPTIQWDTAAIQAGAKEIMAGLEQTMAEGGPRVAAGLQPVHDVLQKIATTDFNTAPISTVGGILADMLTSSENLTQSGLQPLVGMLSQVPSVAGAGAEGFAALDAAIASTGFSVSSTGQIINDTTGQIVGDLTGMSTASKDPLQQLVDSILGTGAGAMQAKVQWATEIADMKNLIANFVIDTTNLLIGSLAAWTGWAVGTMQELFKAGQALNIFVGLVRAFGADVSTHLTTAAGHFNTFAQQATQGLFKAGQAANTFASALMGAFARDVQTHLTRTQTAFATFASQVTSRLTSTRSAITTFQSAVTTMASQGASRVASFASSFQSAMSRVSSSANSARSSVQQLQSAINSLRSKTVVITTIHRQVIQRVFAASGGAFIASSPTKVGPLNVSEFGQKELVTVTPLENPGGQTITGPGMQVSTSGPNAKAFAKSGDKSINLGDVVNMLREVVETNTKGKQSRDRVFKVVQPQIITLKLEGKELTRFINRNLFELSDSVIS